MSCKNGDSPFYPDSPISEFNPCMMSNLPYKHYLPKEYEGDFTVPDIPNRMPPARLPGWGQIENSLPDIFKSSSNPKGKQRQNKWVKFLRIGLFVIGGISALIAIILLIKD